MALARLDRLIEAVQRNCHVTDARHARGMTLCTYLLEMREFFRWEHGIALGETPQRSEVGPWLTQREALWETLEEAGFEDVPVDDNAFDPFDSVAINRVLLPEGLIYGAGIGRFHKPHFFLGSLRREQSTPGGQGTSAPQVLVCGCEYARDLTAIPAALQRDTIVVRQEALRQWLWEKAEAWQLKRQPGAMQAALDAYGYFDDAAAAALERMTATETASLILHEQGEFAAGQRLGPDWETLLAGLKKRRAELLLRAIRDNWADCLSTLPRLIERQSDDGGAGDAALHFWFSNFDGMRRELFPALVAAYQAWGGGGRREKLAQVVAAGAAHWGEVATSLLQRFHGDPARVAVLEEELERRSHDLAPIAL